MEPVIELAHVSKRFVRRTEGSRPFRDLLRLGQPAEADRYLWALRDVSLRIHQGEAVGILGRNGAGKSTMLKIIAGTMQPTSGKVTVRGTIAPLLQLGAGFTPQLSGRENLFLNASFYGLTRRQVVALYDDIVEFAELRDFMEMPLGHYSSGMQMRLGFAIAIHLKADILLVDEALAVGDQAFQRKCLEKVRERRQDGCTLVLVSHSPETIAQFCERSVVVEGGLVVPGKAGGPLGD
ncbi:MAG: lipopolysaccharide transport system ATP-binding protein [Thermoplasmata archaeon]|jgi:ABC-type polysaccharide/polyol phosphate transport system ATPase subunit|nr:lipopolysaccharide transport system ATP-binding protein [Thermoplasmata archaeon]